MSKERYYQSMNSKGMKNLRRINQIFEDLEAGVAPYDIVEKHERQIEYGHEQNIAGREREEYVARVLADLSFVDSAKVSKPKDKNDRRGRDIIVYLNQGVISVSFDSVFIQVKSSYQSIKEFKTKIIRRCQIPPGQLDEWLMKKRLIIINGKNSEEEIVAEFTAQLDLISHYH